MSFALYWHKCNSQEYDNSAQHVLKPCTAINLMSQVCDIMFTTVALSEHVVAWRLIIAFPVKALLGHLETTHMNIYRNEPDITSMT